MITQCVRTPLTAILCVGATGDDRLLHNHPESATATLTRNHGRRTVVPVGCSRWVRETEHKPIGG